MKRLAGSVMLLAAFSVGGCMTAPATHVAAPAWVSTSTASKQEIWGVYDGLAGTTWSAPNAYVLFYRWAVPGQVLVEEFRHPTTGELSGTNTIVPGPAPGTLTLTSSVANMQWTGTLDGKGNALFARDGLMRMPMRTGRTASGDLFQEKVTLDGVRVASVDRSTIYSPLGKAAVDNSAVAAPATPASVVATTSPSAATSASSVSETPGSGWTAESQASLDRTLDNLARQAAQERASAQDPQPGPSTQSTPDTLAGQSTEAEQDAVVARAMAQARQVARDAGDEGAVDRAISDMNRFLDQQAQASKPPVQSTQPAKVSSQAPSSETVNFSYMGCVVDEFAVRTTYISNIARIVHLGDQQRWNEEFFRRHVAEAYDRDLSKLHAYCALDRNEQAGLERRLNGTRKQHARQGIPIIEVDWSPEKRF